MSDREVLTFQLGQEEYGIDILSVQEIRSFEAPTRIANAEPQFLGVLDLRGLIVPIIDLRIQVNLKDSRGCVASSITASTVVMFVNHGDNLVGMVVDGVNEVARLTYDSIKPAPRLGLDHRSAAVVAEIAVSDGRNLLLTDVGSLINSAEGGNSKFYEGHTVPLDMSVLMVA